MPNELMTNIEAFRKYMDEQVAKVNTEDQVVNALFNRLWESVSNDLQTIWFYHEALVDRTKKGE